MHQSLARKAARFFFAYAPVPAKIVDLDALETITSKKTSGDLELADVKQRVGEKVCIFGGFNEHLLKSDNPQDVIDEVKRCIDEGAEGGGYILRSTGQIFHANPGMIELMCQTARDYGRYN